MDQAQKETLRSVLAKLPDELRRCFLLRFSQGFEESEIAVLMKIPIEMVRKNLARVRRLLRSLGGHKGRDHDR